MQHIFSSFSISDVDTIKKNIFLWLKQFDTTIFLDSNENKNSIPCTYGLLAGAGISEQLLVVDNSLHSLKKFYDKEPSWIFGYITYDVKNELENLSSNHPDYLNFPKIFFFKPRFIFLIKDNTLQIGSFSEKQNQKIYEQIVLNNTSNEKRILSIVNIKHRVTETQYLKNIEAIKKHIQQGDIYEMNYCMEFYDEMANIDPYSLFIKQNTITHAPFAAFLKVLDNKFLICSSPERYLQKNGDRIISQPIKGTIRRGANRSDDELLKNELQNSEKDKSENVMIVDLVRNDLSRIAKQDTVNVDELFGIYSFSHVHQMISTISCSIRQDLHWTDAIKYTFPMGSMTGAPKIKAMQIIEDYEQTKRGLYSGTVGYISPTGDFDFNVVIRSIFFNASTHYLSYITGGAITNKSNPKEEYQECLLKAKAMIESLSE